MSALTTGVPFPVSSPVSDSDSNPDVPNGADTNADPPSPTEGPGSTAHILEEAKQQFENQSAGDEELRKSLGKMITLCNKLVRALVYPTHYTSPRTRPPASAPSSRSWPSCKRP